MAERIVVPFSGEGAGTGELSWGQLSIWESIEASGQSRTLSGTVAPPADVTMEHIVRTTGWLVGRHPALRTTYPQREGLPPLQVCHASGELSIEVVDLDGRDPDALADELRDRYQRVPFDYGTEWPLRIGVVRDGDRPVRQVVVYLHLSVDAGGLTALIADLNRLDPATGQAPPPEGLPPLEQSRRQQGPGGRRQQAGTLRHWEHVLRTIPAHPYGPPVPGREPEFLEVRFRSPATLLAARLAAARTGTGTASVLLAAFAVALARAKGCNPVMALVAVSNRFRPGLSESVSSVSFITPLLVDVAGATLAEAVGRASRGALSAYKNGYCDPAALNELEEVVQAERGGVELGTYFNDRRQEEPFTGPLPTEDEVRAAVAGSTLDWPVDPERPQTALYLYVADAPDAVEFLLTVDLRHFTRAELEALVRDFEAVAVRIALEPTADTGVPAPAVAAAAT